MDPSTFAAIIVVIFVTSAVISVIVLLVGWICFTPERVLMKVFPYIKESGQWIYTMYVIAWILIIVLFNTFLTVSDKYNPHDGLDCFGYYDNGSTIKVTSEEQKESENVTEISCYRWNFDIAGGIGHAAAILTLSWLFSSIVLWIKLKLYFKILICIRKDNPCSLCGLMGLILPQIIFATGPLFAVSYLINTLSIYQLFDIMLFCAILLSGFFVIPNHRKPKTLAEYCKMAVENKEGKEERALEEIKRVRGRVQDDPIQVDLLVELAELECKKALGDVYYYGLKKDETRHTCKANCSCMNTEDEEEAETNTNSDIISRKEMKIIAQVAYGKVTKDLQQQNNNQGNDTGAGGDEDESAGLLKRTRNKTTYVQL